MKRYILEVLPIAIVLALGMLIARASSIPPVTSDVVTYTQIVAGQLAQLQIMGEYDTDDLTITSPSGEVIDLKNDGPILIPVEVVDDYTIHLKGDARWITIMVTSYDGLEHWLSIEGDTSGWTIQAGNTAITSYHWD